MKLFKSALRFLSGAVRGKGRLHIMTKTNIFFQGVRWIHGRTVVWKLAVGGATCLYLHHVAPILQNCKMSCVRLLCAGHGHIWLQYIYTLYIICYIYLYIYHIYKAGHEHIRLLYAGHEHIRLQHIYIIYYIYLYI